MKVTLSVAEVIELADTHGSLRGKQHPKLIVLSRINFDRLAPIAKASFKQRDELFTPEYRAYEKARDALTTEFKDKNGFAKEDEDFGALNFQYEEQVLALARSDAHKKAVEDFNENFKVYDESLKTEVELELQAIDIAWLPKKMNLLTFTRIKPILKDADEYPKHEIEKVTLLKGEIVQIIQKVLGDNGHFVKDDKGKRPVIEMVFSLPIVRRLSTFMDNSRPIAKEFSTLRGKHTLNAEFALFMEERNAILREGMPMEDKIARINQAYNSLPEEAKTAIDGSDKEISDFGMESVTLEVSKMRLDDFDENIDTDILSVLFPFISE